MHFGQIVSERMHVFLVLTVYLHGAVQCTSSFVFYKFPTYICKPYLKFTWNLCVMFAKSLDLKPESLTYGFEFEFIGTSRLSARKRFQEYMERHCIPYVFTGKYGVNETNAWTLGADSSVGGEKTGKLSDNGLFGYEMVSPILHTTDFNQIEIILSGIQNILDGQVNETCGTHVHFGNLVGLTHKDPLRNGNTVSSFMDSVVWLYSKLQPFLFNNLVKKDRGWNPFCGRYIDGMYEKNKYLALTSRGIHGTLEVRLHHGTLYAHEIIQWAEVNAKFLIYCAKNGPHVSLPSVPSYLENGDMDKGSLIPVMTNLLVQFGYDEQSANHLIVERISNRDD